MRKNFAYNTNLATRDAGFSEVDNAFVSLNKQAIL